MDRRSRLAAGALLALAAAPSWARTKLDPPDLARYLSWGPLRVRPRIEVTDIGHDDNILASASHKEADFTASWAPSVDGLVLFGRRAFLTFRDELAFRAFLDNRDQNFVDQRGSARFTLPLRRFGVFAAVNLERVHERPVDLQDVRPERNEATIGYGVVFLPGWRTQVELARSLTGWSYFDEEDPGIADRLDRDAERTTLELDYLLLGRTHLTLGLHRGSIRFDQPLAGATRDSTEWGVLPGIDFGRDGAISGWFRLGWSEIEPERPGQAAFADVVAETSAAWHPNGRTTVGIEGWRRPGFSIFRDSTYYLDTRATVRGVYYLNRIFGLDLTVGAGKLGFPESSGGVRREDRLRQVEFGVRLRLSENSLGRRVEYRARVVRSRTDSNLEGFDRSRTAWNLGAVVGF